MGRPPRPWFDSQSGTWKVYFKGKRRTLARGTGPKAEREAWDALTLLQNSGDMVPPQGLAPERNPEARPSRTTYPPMANAKTVPKVRELVGRFLEIGTIGLQPVTVEGYTRNLKSFASEFSERPCTEIQPYHVTEWLARQARWNATTKRAVVTAIKRCWSWSHQDGRIPFNLLIVLKRPTAAPQARIPCPEEIKSFIDGVVSSDFAALLTFSHATGCRIGEAVRLEARHLNADISMAVMENKTAWKTGKQRVIYIPVAIRKMVEDHARARPTGVIFRSKRGNPWTRNSIACQVRLVRKRTGLGPDAVAKMMRHDWITEALSQGIPVKVVAELAGHTSSDMIDRVYSHLSDRGDLLSKAAESVRTPKPEDMLDSPLDRKVKDK